jgi:hypothetical protein
MQRSRAILITPFDHASIHRMPAVRRLTVTLPLELYRRAVRQAKAEQRSVVAVQLAVKRGGDAA